MDKQKWIRIVMAAGHEKALATTAVVFSFLYHDVFFILFYILGVFPMFYFNILSVTLFTSMLLITPKAKSYVLIYSCCLFEVVVHQILAVHFLGGDSAFYYLIIPMGFVGILIVDHKFALTITYGLIATCVCIYLAIMSPHIPPVYDIPVTVMFKIRCVNIVLGIFLVFMEIILFTFRATNVEEQLEYQVKKKTKELKEQNQKVYDLQNHMINSLASLVENRDSDTGEHIQRTSAYVELISRRAFEKKIYDDEIDEDFIDQIKRAAPMHDIGKIVIDDSILKKPGRLTEEEFSQMKTHTTEGQRIVKEIMSVASDREYVKIASDIAAYHHERWDGTGYPSGLKAEQIPVCARIMAIADVYDALVSKRCYKQAMSAEQAFSIIAEESGTHFDPVLAELFLSMKDEVNRINRQSTQQSPPL